MKKVIMILLVLAVTGACLDYVGPYQGRMLVSAARQTLAVPKNLALPAYINSWASVPLVPEIVSGKTRYDLNITCDESVFQQKKTKVTVSDSEAYQDLTLSGEVTFAEDHVRNRITLSSNMDMEVTLTYRFSFQHKVRVFSEATYKGSPGRILAFIPADGDGEALAVVTNWDIDPGMIPTNKMQTTSFSLSTKVILKRKAETSLEIKIIPFYLVQSKRTEYPIEYSGFLSNKLVRTFGSEKTSITNAPGRVTELLAKLGGRSSNPEFPEFHDVTLSSSPGDSLTLVSKAKAVCSNSGVPCRIVVGIKDKKYYAWLDVFDGAWQTVDLAAGTRSPPEGYTVVYVEPLGRIEVVPVEPSDDEIYSALKEVTAEGLNPVVYYVLLGVLMFVAIVLFFKFKARDVLARTSKKPAHETGPVNGAYEIVGDASKVTDPLLSEVLEKISKKNGRVDVEEYARELHYSKELVDWAVRSLVLQGIIKKKETT